MNTIKFTINVAAMDCYIYGGYLFIVRVNGDLVYIPMSRIMHKLYDAYPNYRSLLILSFSRNDYFNNSTGQIFLGIPEVRRGLQSAWKHASENIVFFLDWSDIEEDAVVICGVDSPVLDLKMYAMRMFLGCKNGLYESNLRLDEDNYTINPEKIRKRFDAKVVGINSGYGTIILSAGNDGLFNAQITSDVDLKVCERPDAPVSFRTGWSSTDLINYEDSSVFEYLANDVEKLNRQVKYSRYDDNTERKRIVRIGSKKYSMSEMIDRTRICKDDVLYSFNSSQSSFLYTKNGIYVVNLLKNNDKKDIYLSSRKRMLSDNSSSIVNKPISASVIPAGCVIEFFDNVIAFQGHQMIKLEDEPTMRVRTFMNSVRYRNIVATVKMNDITLHSLAPLETSKLLSHNRDAIQIQQVNELLTNPVEYPF